MRWSTIQLIWLRELRDQLRDRRTLFTMVALPLVLYPLLGVLLLLFGLRFLGQETTIGLVRTTPNSQNFPEPFFSTKPTTPESAVGWVVYPTSSIGGVSQLAGMAGLAQPGQSRSDYCCLIEEGEVPEILLKPGREKPSVLPSLVKYRFRFLDLSQAELALNQEQVDLLVWAPPGFLEQIAKGESPTLQIQGRENDERSRLASEQFLLLVERWKAHLRAIRFKEKGLPGDFAQPFQVKTPKGVSTEEFLAAENLLNLLVRTFPFMLVMWSLAGALHLAVDICAGEKERGTMETLLISPAGREEIVYGKFLTIWVFSAATALMHLFSMALVLFPLNEQLPDGGLAWPGIFWCVVLILPLSALFSAISLAIGAYARSSKEGQNYLMPLFWVTMPLILLTMIPGVELNPFYSMIPVTGVALLMQKLMLTPTLDQVPWFYFIPVLATIILYSWLALRWAIMQFQSEQVLFRVSERLDMGLWLRNLFREKQPLPTLHQALSCFVLLMVLRWLSWDLGNSWSLLTRWSIILIAFVATPPLFMGLVLTTRFRRTLSLSIPHPGYLLASFLFLPLAEMAHFVLTRFPRILQVLRDRQSLIHDALLRSGEDPVSGNWMFHIIVLGLLAALSKEIAFRGFILSGLRNQLSTWTAILLSSFLFAIYHMNAFALLPAFLMGVVAGWLTVRSSSLLPAILLHMGSNMLLLSGPLVFASYETSENLSTWFLPILLPVALISTLGAILLLWKLPPGRLEAE